ncbi:sugar kinase [Streptosporangium sp. NPDC002721]|uniref:sugar kinase n=1 Tax=Streptosporangium sp. NPDC002721 TaxID=3366188 RepID=UPI0036D03CA7
MTEFDLVTLGEAMAVVRGADVGPLRPGFAARLSFAGAEATVAIAMSRLGHRAAWCGRLGTDPAGDMILGGLRGEGVDVSTVGREPDAPTGLLTRHQRVAGRTTVTYYRHGQAGSRLAPGDLPGSLLGSARLLHVTGITPALGETAARAVAEAAGLARAAGVTVSFDVNYRSRLWPPGKAGPVLAEHAARHAPPANPPSSKEFQMTDVSRRVFLRRTAAVGGGLLASAALASAAGRAARHR